MSETEPVEYEASAHAHLAFAVRSGGDVVNAVDEACRLAVTDELTELANQLEKTRLRWRGDQDEHHAIGWRGLG